MDTQKDIPSENNITEEFTEDSVPGVNETKQEESPIKPKVSNYEYTFTGKNGKQYSSKQKYVKKYPYRKQRCELKKFITDCSDAEFCLIYDLINAYRKHKN